MNHIYEYAKKTYYENIFEISNMEENFHLITYALLAFFTPFMLGHPQLLVGSAVNAALILAATYLRGHKILPVIILPNIAVLLRGAIFGPFTIFLIYLIPFIWIGNAILVYVYKWMMHKKTNYFLATGAGALFKTTFLFSSAYFLVSIKALPAIFLTTMGLFQLYTAGLGAIIAFSIIKGREFLTK
jgi:hypothetical protein